MKEEDEFYSINMVWRENSPPSVSPSFLVSWTDDD